MGALLFSNATFTETLKVVLQTNMTYYPFGYAGTAQDWLFDWRTGVVTLAPGSSAQLYPFIKADIDRYIAFWNQNIQPIWADIGYKVSPTDIDELSQADIHTAFIDIDPTRIYSAVRAVVVKE